MSRAAFAGIGAIVFYLLGAFLAPELPAGARPIQILCYIVAFVLVVVAIYFLALFFTGRRGPRT